jgi:hypothetical protein
MKYIDDETQALLEKKEALESELEKINQQLSILEKDLLKDLEEGKWYEYINGTTSIFFKYSKSDFIKDGHLLVHTAFSETLTRMQSIFSHQSIYRIPIKDLELKKTNEDEINKMLIDEIEVLKDFIRKVK